MPKDQEVRQTVFANERKLVEAGNFKAAESLMVSEFLYPDEFQDLVMPAGELSYMLTPTCFKCVFPKPPIADQKRQQIEEISFEAQKIVKKVETAVRDVYFISAIRGEVKPFVETGVGEPELGTHGERIIEILSMIFGRAEYKNIAGKIIEWASKFGMKELKAGYWGRNILSFDYMDPELRTHLNMALASQGSRQILTIITQLFWSKPGSVIMIEEPEISLHIESQLELPKMFSDTVNEGKQVIVTTHSEHLILALKPLIVNGELKPEDVAIWHFKKTEEGTKAEKLNLTDKGIIEGWIPSYVEAEGEIIKEWFNTLLGQLEPENKTKRISYRSEDINLKVSAPEHDRHVAEAAVAVKDKRKGLTVCLVTQNLRHFEPEEMRRNYDILVLTPGEYVDP
ncbi:MAG: AAA family ATPase [Methanophagales archaeon]|nr:AAA family ATPase [Methanophagales archaeon]